ncbi:hypothetical protein RHMOL_Rhmol13G0248000 [Rhododendron molle]|uniref:Uncharacterized protein n=1 Tax=Rhododendron molle TaxID=49168 RepID=A0ACC0LBZ1_RHOML|nr:hypothetical protein RHMOL_Rhmol13G0248000 [Rhododendron molle]
MASSRPCSSCGERSLADDDDGNSFCASCGAVQDFDNFQHSLGGISGPTGTFVHTGSAGSGSTFNYNYKETKIYYAKQNIERITSLFDFSPSKENEVRVMVETVTEGEYGQGDWFPVLIGACAYIVMRRDNKSLALVEVGDKVGCDVHELGRMVSRVVQFMRLKLPEFDIVDSFQRAVRTCFVSLDNVDKVGRMLKQGIFLVQCMVKWYLTTGRRPLPVVVAVLVFVAQLNAVNVRIEDVAMAFHVAVVTCKLRYKELLESLVKVAQVLPWGKDITVKNMVKNAPFVLEYMELKSMSKRGEKRKVVDHVGLDMDDLVGSCLSEEAEYGLDNHGVENDSQYFKVQDKRSSPSGTIDYLETLKISHECLSMMYSEYSNEISNTDYFEEGGCKNRRKKGRGFDLLDCREWWKGKSELSRKLLLEKILEKDVGLVAMPPSFVAGCLGYQRRREKIKAAKLRINKIMGPQNGDSGDNGNLCISDGVNVGKKRRRRLKVYVDWEDFIIETLLLHQVHEEEIEKGHYNTLLDLYVFNSGSSIPGVTFEQMKLQIKLGVSKPLQQLLDIEKVKSIFPYWDIMKFEVVDGGLICSSGVHVEEMGDKNDDCYIVNAAVYVGYFLNPSASQYA